MNSSNYRRLPNAVENEIPIFFEANVYTRNYDTIAREHLDAVAKGISNPFMSDTILEALESSTLGLIQRYAVPGHRILDIGVGLGRLLSQVSHCERYGTDVSFSYLEKAKERGIEVCCAFAEDLPYRDELFDVVVCTDVLEHVLDLNKAIESILRVLKREGILIVRVPDREDLSPYLKPSYPFQFAHLRNFDEASLRLMFSRVFKCECLDIEHVFAHVTSKIRCPLPRGRGLLTMALDWVTRHNASLYKWTARTLYRPVEVNCVVRKLS